MTEVNRDIPQSKIEPSTPPPISHEIPTGLKKKFKYVLSGLKIVVAILTILVALWGASNWFSSQFRDVREEANNKFSAILEVVNENKTNLAVLGEKVANIEVDIGDIKEDIGDIEVDNAEIKDELNSNQGNINENAIYEQYGYQLPFHRGLRKSDHLSI